MVYAITISAFRYYSSTHLPFHTADLFLSVQLLVELAHACCALASGCKRPLYLVFTLLTRAVGCAGQILLLFLFIFGDTFFPVIASSFSGIPVNI